MSGARRTEPTFEITHQPRTGHRLVAGFSSFGLAGLTAVDFLVDHLELEETGYVTVDSLPSITPFENGVPRHHTRLFSRPDLDLTVLVNELFVPVWAADAFATEVLSWTDGNEVEEVTVLAGVPVPHGPEEHDVFYIATEDYRTAMGEDFDVAPMGGGFLDGVKASLVGRGMDSALRVGVFATPVHAQPRDLEAALRLVQTFEDVFEIDVDTDELEAFASEVEQYYKDLEERASAMESLDSPEDRMYM